jgi:hypothetical protein
MWEGNMIPSIVATYMPDSNLCWRSHVFCMWASIEKLTFSSIKYSLCFSRVSCSSVRKVPDYRLDHRGSIPGRYFSFSLCPDQLLRPTRGGGEFFRRGKARPGRHADHSPYLVPRSRMSRTHISSPLCHLHGGSGTVLLLHMSYMLISMELEFLRS